MSEDRGTNFISMNVTLAALERLLGGDTELEGKLRHQIAEQFAKKHLRPLLSEPSLQRRLDDFKESLDSIFKAECQAQIGAYKSGFWDKKLTLSADFEKKFKETIKQHAEKEFGRIVDEVLIQQEKYWSRIIEGHIERVINAGIEKRINEQLEARFKAALAAAK